MKKLTKVLFAAGGALLLGGGVANYLLATPQAQTSDLTLADLEAGAKDVILDDGQTGVFDHSRNDSRGGCKGAEGRCVIHN